MEIQFLKKRMVKNLNYGSRKLPPTMRKINKIYTKNKNLIY